MRYASAVRITQPKQTNLNASATTALHLLNPAYLLVLHIGCLPLFLSLICYYQISTITIKP
jgi:hypothetical protein